MRHSRFIALLGVVGLIVVVILLALLLAQPAGAAGQRIVDWPELPWAPDLADVAYVSRTIWGEVRGCPVEEQEGVGWCIVLRKRSSLFPDTIEGVVLQPYQWQGYSPNNPEEPFHDMARAILIADHNGEPGPLPDGMFWCSGDGRHQRFRNTWLITEETRFYP